MIISLRGTSGSGKSTLVRKITALYGDGGTPIHVDGRRKAYYTVHERDRGRALVVPGHYEIANGGIDTLPSLDAAYEIARIADIEGHDVLMEGKNMSDGPPHALALWREGRDVRIVHVHEPLARCVDSVRRRGHAIAETTIEHVMHKCEKDAVTFRVMGMPYVQQAPRGRCLEIVREWLCL